MCGIAGVLSSGTPIEEIRKDVDLLVAALFHRGPDDRGSFCLNGVGLGMTRLSIIDIQNGGQPMASDDRQVIVIHNGEIYNFQETKSALQKEGWKFSTDSDTEVILVGYLAWGIDIVRHLNGIFAFAVLDLRIRRLFLARDHFGVKPLFYYSGSSFAFCSEPAPLWRLPHVSRTINRDALSEFLAYKYVLGPYGMTTDLKKLRPGHYLEVTLDGKVVAERPYWKLDRFQTIEVSLHDAMEKFEELLKAAVHNQLVGDVPISMLLSGGIDSALLLWAATQSNRGQDLTAFTIAFEQKSFDESSAAARSARLLETPHEIQTLHTPKPSDLDRDIRIFGEPFANNSVPANLALFSAASQQSKVALNGSGADELFAGYSRYYSVSPPMILRALHHFAPGLQRFLGCLPVGSSKRNYISKARHYLDACVQPEALRHEAAVRLLNPSEFSQLFQGQCNYPTALTELSVRSPDGDYLQKAQWTDLHSMLTGDYLSLIDRTSMANSLEVRVPFLDPDLVEFAFQLPPSLKLAGWRKKVLLREIAKKNLSRSVSTASKQGFETPVGAWFRGSLSSALREKLNDRRIEEILDRRMIREIEQEHQLGFRNRGNLLLALYSLSVWMDEFGITN